ncbi:MAG: hypothetical protein LBQ83_07050, partial [Candidatus Margulisbacteria bacterium]|nr:hypothetical protein [Candidatus Margulisiibacteriota bacterium]
MALKKIILLLILPGLIRAAELAGGRELAVTQIAPGARALALGRAYTAHPADAVSFIWNPGSLAFARQKELATIQTQLSAEVDFFGLSGALPLSRGSLGFYWAQLQVADI